MRKSDKILQWGTVMAVIAEWLFVGFVIVKCFPAISKVARQDWIFFGFVGGAWLSMGVTLIGKIVTFKKERI